MVPGVNKFSAPILMTLPVEWWDGIPSVFSHLSLGSLALHWAPGGDASPLSFLCYCCSVTKASPTLWDPMDCSTPVCPVLYHLPEFAHTHVQDCSTPGCPVLHHLPEFAHTHVHWVGDAIQSSCPLLPPSPPAFNLSQHQGLFQWALCIGWSKYWSFSFSISPSNESSRLIPFRTDWFDLLAVQGTLKSLLQHLSESINSSVLSLLLYGLTFTSKCDYWKSHSFD